MAQAKLPLKIRIDVQDQFEEWTSAVQISIRALEAIVGRLLSCDVEWDMLWTELKPGFPDKATFVPYVAGIISAWCEILGNRLEDPKLAAWTKDIGWRWEIGGRIKLYVQVSDDHRPRTTSLPFSATFTLYLPRNTVVAPHMYSSGLESDFDNLFSPETNLAGDKEPVSTNDDWADVDETEEAQSISTGSKAVVPSAPDDVLPRVETLSQPDILFRSLTPYLLHVTLYGTTKLVVQGTHQPSLQLLSEYLQRWMKRDHSEVRKIPLLRATLGESNLGFGLSYDTLTIEPHDHNQQRYVEVNPTTVLVFIEGVLGYRLAHSKAGSWEYRREIAFK